MSEDIKQSDSLQSSWAAHELFALVLTLVLAVWIVTKYGGEAQSQSLTNDRDKARAEKQAELMKADEEALSSYGVVDEALKRYRIPIVDAMNIVVKSAQQETNSITREIAGRMNLPSDIKMIELPLPEFLNDESELDDASLIAQGKVFFQTKICFTCHQVDPAVPAAAGMALKAPNFMGEFWGKERVVHKGLGGPIEKVKFNSGYFAESVRKPMDRVVKGALAPMPPPPPTTDEELKALLAYVKSLSKAE